MGGSLTWWGFQGGHEARVFKFRELGRVLFEGGGRVWVEEGPSVARAGGGEAWPVSTYGQGWVGPYHHDVIWPYSAGITCYVMLGSDIGPAPRDVLSDHLLRDAEQRPRR